MANYTDVATLKSYGIITSTNVADDAILQDAIDRAQADIDGICGKSFLASTVVDEIAQRAYTDRAGILYVEASQACPVRSVSALSWYGPYRQWTVLNLVNTDVFLPPGHIPPNLRDNQVRFMGRDSTVPYASLSEDKLIIKWSYAGGYATVPPALKQICTRLAWWHYELRKAPLGTVAYPQLGQIDIPVEIPKDVMRSLSSWKLWG